MAYHKVPRLWLIPFAVIILLHGFVVAAPAMTPEDEKKLGKQVFLEIEKTMEIVRDLPTQDFLDRVGNSLLAHVGPVPYEFRFYLVNSKDPNAFAVPGGFILVTTGLIVLAGSEQEVAGVLSHEIAHVMGKHVAQIMEKAKRINIATLAAMIAGAILGGGGKASEAAAMSAMALSQALVLKYTREHETDADQNGLRYVIKAGYDPNGIISFLNRMLKYSLASAPKMPAYLSTHPVLENRISLMENLLLIEPGPKGPFRETASFRQVQIRAFIEEREPHVAVSHFESFVKANPQDLYGLLGLGLAYQKMGRMDKTIEILETAYSFAPREPDVLRELGIAYYLSGKLDQAIENLETFLSVSSMAGGEKHDLQALYYLGKAYQGKEEFDKALPIFFNVQKGMPDFPDIYLCLGSVFGRKGQKGLSHFYYGKHFNLRSDRNSALLHFRTAVQWLERRSPEREVAEREIRQITQQK